MPDETPDRGSDRPSGGAPDRSRPDEREARQAAAAARIRHQSTWVDVQLRQAVERGEFDDLPGYGKPLRDLGSDHDPDWWVKRLIEREQITGVLPPSLQMRKEDAQLDEVLDRLPTERQVRREVEEFNARVRWALYRPPEGPPMVTPQRDVDTEVERWAARREERLRQHRARQAAARHAEPVTPPRRLRRRLWPR